MHRPPRSPGELGPFQPESLTATNHPYYFPIGGLPIFADSGLAGFVALVRAVIRDRERQPVRHPVLVSAVSVDGIQVNGMAVPGGGFGTILSEDPAAIVTSWVWSVLPDALGQISVEVEFAGATSALLGLSHPLLLGFSSTVAIV